MGVIYGLLTEEYTGEQTRMVLEVHRCVNSFAAMDRFNLSTQKLHVSELIKAHRNVKPHMMNGAFQILMQEVHLNARRITNRDLLKGMQIGIVPFAKIIT